MFLSLSLCFLHPFPPPFYASTSLSLYYCYLPSLSLSLIILYYLLSSLLVTLRPFHSLIYPIHAPFLSVIFSLFMYVPFFLFLCTTLPIFPIKKKNCGILAMNYARGWAGETTMTTSRRRLKCSCVNRSATFAKGRILRRISHLY